MKWKKYWSSSSKSNNTANKLTFALLIIYLMILFWMLLFKLGVQFSYMGNRSVNLIPFGQSLTSNGKTDFSEIVLNVVVFVPLGIYAGVLYKRWNFGNKLFFFFFISLLIEGLQFILRVGAFDITDIITNISGGIIGFIIFEAIEKLFNDSVRSQKIINVVASMATVLIISLLLLLKLNLLPVRYQ